MYILRNYNGRRSYIKKSYFFMISGLVYIHSQLIKWRKLLKGRILRCENVLSFCFWKTAKENLKRLRNNLFFRLFRIRKELKSNENRFSFSHSLALLCLFILSLIVTQLPLLYGVFHTPFLPLIILIHSILCSPLKKGTKGGKFSTPLLSEDN